MKHSIITSLLLVLSSVCTAEGSFTGVWKGHYYYPDGRPPVAFEWNLEDNNGALYGRAVEPNTFDQRGGQLFSRLSGRSYGNDIEVIKSYEHNDSSVSYIGRFNGSTIEGTWYVGNLQGRFELEGAKSVYYKELREYDDLPQPRKVEPPKQPDRPSPAHKGEYDEFYSKCWNGSTPILGQCPDRPRPESK